MCLLFGVENGDRVANIYEAGQIDSCWKPEYRVLANGANRVNERVSVPAQMVLPVRCLYRYERYGGIPKPLPIPASYSCEDSAVGIVTGALAR